MSGLPADHFQAIGSMLSTWRRPLLITHTKADGDGIGSIVAMRELARQVGCDPLAMLFEPAPDQYRLLDDPADPLRVWQVDVSEHDLAEVDAVVVLDTCSYSQVMPLADWLRETKLPKLAVDHHITRDDLATSYLVDESAAANCVILHDWARAVGWDISATVGRALFVGIATDTGWFRHANTTGRVFKVAEALCGASVAPHALFQSVYQQATAARLRLLGAAIESMEIVADGRVAVMTLTADTFQSCGAVHADTEDMVNEPMRISSVVVSVFLVEQGGLIRVGLRSKSPLSQADPDIDVAAIAGGLGGGGHRRASGARLNMPMSDARAKVVDQVVRALGE